MTYLYVLFSIGLLQVSISDIKHRVIPNEIIALMCLSWVAVQTVYWPGEKLIICRILSMLMAGLFICAVFIVFGKVFRKKIMGGGDIKLIMVCALYLNTGQWPDMIFLSCLFGIPLCIAALIMKNYGCVNKKKTVTIPYGVCISFAALILIWSDYFK